MAKILVIDDENSIRNTLQEILEYEKHEVVLAEDGIQGLEIFDNDKFDIVLCDIKMPKMDGLEVIEKIPFYFKRGSNNPCFPIPNFERVVYVDKITFEQMKIIIQPSYEDVLLELNFTWIEPFQYV